MSSTAASSPASRSAPSRAQPPQHGIDQTGIAGGVAVRLRQPHREIDGGVVGHVEQQNLRRAEKERGLDPRRLLRRAAIEEEAEEMAQRAEPAQHGRDQRPRQRAVALRQAGQRGARGGAVELIVERAAAAQHAVENVGGEAPGGEAGHGVGVAARRSG